MTVCEHHIRRIGIQNQRAILRVEGAQVNRSLLSGRVSAVEEVPPVRQKRGPPVQCVSAGKSGRRRRRAPCRRHFHEGSNPRAEHDNAITIPRAPHVVAHGTKRHCGAAGCLDFLQVSVSKEPYVAAVRRPERRRGAGCVWERHRRHRTNVPHPQLDLSFGAAGDNRETAAIRRDGERCDRAPGTGRRSHNPAIGQVGCERDGWRRHLWAKRRKSDTSSTRPARMRRLLRPPPPTSDGAGQTAPAEIDRRGRRALCNPRQLIGEILRALPAALGILPEAFFDDAIQRLRRRRERVRHWSR